MNPILLLICVSSVIQRFDLKRKALAWPPLEVTDARFSVNWICHATVLARVSACQASNVIAESLQESLDAISKASKINFLWASFRKLAQSDISVKNEK
jgi:hypothetical protein